MANAGLPLGGQFPTRAEIGANLPPYVENPRQVGANQGYGKYNRLSSIWANESTQFMNDQYLASQDNTYTSNNLADEQRDFESSIVKLTDVPTSSTNYSRPRTVAAGYNPVSKTMTVVFRDGTFYNYYDVSPGEWENFSSSYSKGRPWLNRKNSQQGADGLFINKPRGQANIEDIDPNVREQLYRVARTQQLYKKPRAHKEYSYKSPQDRVPQQRTQKSGGTISSRRRTGYVPRPRKAS
jgi:hypothetical protein